MKLIDWIIRLLMPPPKVDTKELLKLVQAAREEERKELAQKQRPAWEHIRTSKPDPISPMIDYQRATMAMQEWPIRRNATLGGRQEPADFDSLHLTLYVMLRDEVSPQIIMQKLKMTSSGFNREFAFADWFIHSYHDRLMMDDIKNKQNILFREEQKQRRVMVEERQGMLQ
jgi:hypothetical protein